MSGTFLLFLYWFQPSSYSKLFVSHAVIIKKINKDLESSIKDKDGGGGGINGLLRQSVGALGLSFSDSNKY